MCLLNYPFAGWKAFLVTFVVFVFFPRQMRVRDVRCDATHTALVIKVIALCIIFDGLNYFIGTFLNVVRSIGGERARRLRAKVKVRK